MKAEELLSQYLDAARHETKRRELSERDAKIAEYRSPQSTNNNEQHMQASSMSTAELEVTGGESDVQQPRAQRSSFLPINNYSTTSGKRKKQLRRKSSMAILHSLQENLHENIHRLAHLGGDRDKKMGTSVDRESEYVARLPPRINGGLLTNPLCRIENQEDVVEEDVQELFEVTEVIAIVVIKTLTFREVLLERVKLRA